MPRLPSPVGVVRLAVEITKAVVEVVERSVLEAEGPRALPAKPAPKAVEAAPVAPDPASRMRELLEESTRLEGRGSGGLAAMVVAEFVPDEARLIAALSDGGEHAALVVSERGRRGRPETVLLRTSAVGRAAGIREHDLLPVYLARLEARGLVVFVSPNGTDHARDHEVLRAEGCVTEVLDDLRSRGRKARIDLAVVRLSLLGRQVWAATRLS